MTLPMPTESALVTEYDRAHFAVYASLLDANLARARWMTTHGYRLLAGLRR